MLVSAFCIVHCLAAPALAALLPMLNHSESDHWMHAAVAIIGLPVALWATRRALVNDRWLSAALLAGGVAMFFIGHSLGHVSETHETIASLAAGLLLVSGHVLNSSEVCGDGCGIK